VRRLLTIGLLAGLAAGQDRPAGTDLDKWLAFLRPKPEELEWQSIGWRPSLAAAVPEARAARKPILLWAMNGHPLACT